MVGIIVAAVCLLVLTWLTGTIYVNDFSIPSFKLPRNKRVLVVFPHPDDEVNVAGTLWRMGRRGCAVTIAVLTKGERGTPDAHLEPALKQIRTSEMQKAGRILGAHVIQADFGDGQLSNKQVELKHYLNDLIKRERPDIVISYDLAGLYGHEDHIALAEIVHELVSSKSQDSALWYAALPKQMLAMVKLPEHMAKDASFKAKRAVADRRIFVGFGVIAQIRDLYAHQSQRRSTASSMPYHIPLWLGYSFRLFEYYQRVR